MENKSVTKSIFTSNKPTNIFIPGLTSNQNGTGKCIELLENDGIRDIIIFNAKKSLFKISSGFYFNSVLYDKIREYTDGKVNLICHSMGCNYGISAIASFNLANQIKSVPKENLNKIVLISPEVWSISSEEQKAIDIENVKNSNFGEEVIKSSFLSKIDIRKLKWLREFVRTQEIARNMLVDGFEYEPETMIVYSKGDRFVSPNGINNLQTYLNRVSEVIAVETIMHNPLLNEKKGPVLSKKISSFLSE